MICRWLLFSCQVISHSSQPHGLQCTKLPSPSLSSGVCPSSSPLNWWCHPAISSCHSLFLLPSIFPSIRVFSRELAVCLRWPKYWSFSFSISPSNEYSRLISFKIDWFDLRAIQGTLKSLLQHHNLKASFFLSLSLSPTLILIHDYWKNHSLDYMDLSQQSDVSAF